MHGSKPAPLGSSLHFSRGLLLSPLLLIAGFASRATADAQQAGVFFKYRMSF